jgi:hypothetical protein
VREASKEELIENLRLTEKSFYASSREIKRLKKENKRLITCLEKAREMLNHVEGCFNCNGCRDYAKEAIHKIAELLGDSK